MKKIPKIEKSWEKVLRSELKEPYFNEIEKMLEKDEKS
jgi:uracil DNA glycosylase